MMYVVIDSVLMYRNPSLFPNSLSPSAMAKKASSADALHALFSVDNPFRRRPQLDPPPIPYPALTPQSKPVEKGLGLGHEATLPEVDRKRKKENETDLEVSLKRKKKAESGDVGAVEESPRKRRRKRKRDEIEEKYERRKLGGRPEAVEEKDGDEGKVVAVGEKRKASDLVKEMVVPKEEEEFDDEEKLLRTVFVGNLPLRTKKKALMKEFGRFGEIESVRIRSVPLVDSKIPRKGAIIKGKMNDSVDSVHAYIVFKQEQSANAALSHNMSEVGGNHIRVDMACPPRKKLKGAGCAAPLYDRKRTVFVGNLPFDVKDEELYRLFCGANQSDSGLEAVRVIRDPNTSLGKGIAYVLFKTRDAANSIVKQRNLKIRDRLLRVSHAKSEMTTTKSPSKRKIPGSKKDSPSKRLALSSGEDNKPKAKAASLSYQGIRASKSGVLKKTGVPQRPAVNAKHEAKKAGGAERKTHKTKRPAVAARKAKLQKKRKQEDGTPENTRHKKKARKH